MNREHATHDGSEGLRSLAEHAGVTLEEVVGAAARGDLVKYVVIANRPERRIARMRRALEERRISPRRLRRR